MEILWSEKLHNATIGKLEIQHINVGSEEINSKKVDILTLINHAQKTLEKDLIFYCKAKVDAIMSENSWYYISCPACKRRITLRKTDFWCIPCEKQIERPIPRYRLELSVFGHSGSTIFVVFDEENKKLIGQDANTLFEAHTYENINDHNDDDNDNEDDDTQIPKMIGNIIGRELVFKVKITVYNRTTIRQTFTVMRIFDKSVIENKDVIKDNEDASKDEVTVIEEPAKRPFNNIDSTKKDHDLSEQSTSKKIKV
ncbi:replication factor A protein 1-like [Chenopodium quinoa]|uniref:replication factor A protein 1-like n=1 Tax=Chenopodium quinoa TaxID=63459 RepID=UPI000B7859E3|nr:replication factor A protein 1-like [Chenopodium quinoa]